jgi:outer membrane protein insertion porin family
MRNTLNHAFEPTAGSLQQVSFSFAGPGGDADYTKLELEGRYFLPVWRSRRFGQFTLMTGGVFGYGIGDIDFTENRHIATQRTRVLKDDVPLFDRYFPGGINSIRGFGERSLGPREDVVVVVSDGGSPNGRKKRTYHRPIGGSHQLIINNEILVPLVPALNLKGVVFNDIGNAFTNVEGIDLGNLRYSVGAGVRWKSPFGPIRIELGKPLNAKKDERTSTIHFSFGGFGGIGQGGGGNRFSSMF